MNLKDCQILSPQINASDELVFKLKLKKEDWSEQLKELIYLAYREWKTLDFEITGMSWQTDEDMMRKLRWDLGSLMSIYCQEKKINLQEETDRLRAKYWVTSRTDMTRFQLEEAIESYKAWITY